MRTAEILKWTRALTGLDEQRCVDGLAQVAGWHLPSITSEFADRDDIDAVVGGVLLAESVAALTAQGVPHSKLLKKLRDTRDVNELWATWAEIRSAAILIGHPNLDFCLEMEATGPGRKRPDYRLTFPDGSHVWLEFKALGLSEAELAWHRRAAKQFEFLLPPEGLSTAHGWLDSPIRVSAAKRTRAWNQSRVKARELRKLPFARPWGDVRGLAIVGHETEVTYVKRARSAIRTAIDQLPSGQDSWVALWWGNGAPVEAAATLLESVDAPPNVGGVIFIGQSVAAPWSDISCYICEIPRGSDGSLKRVRSTVHDQLAQRVLERFQSSSGVRPTLLRAPGSDGADLLRRDGSRRLFPFNLLFDADPRALAAPHRPPSPVQDTRLDA